VADPFRDRKEVFEEILKMRDEGLVRFVGVSGHCVSSFRAAAQNPDVDVIHPLINRAGMGIIDGTAGEMAEAIRLAAEAGKGVYAMKALAGGNLLSEARRNLTWVRDLPGVHALAVGMLSEAEIDANLALITENKAPDAAWAPLEKATRRIAIMRDFCKGCGKCVPACTNAAITLAPDGKAQVDEARCILCGYCASACPEFVIRVV
jgi:ferredoxin